MYGKGMLIGEFKIINNYYEIFVLLDSENN